MEKAVSFDRFVYMAFWAMLVGIGGHIAVNLSQLNDKMTTIIEKVNEHERTLSKHETLIEQLERLKGH